MTARPEPAWRGEPSPSAPIVTDNDIVGHQPVGALIVDPATVVRSANPAAAELLRIPVEQLVGETFGLPVLPGGVTDINVPDENGTARTLAMRVTELPGRGGARLITLFDVSGRARAYEHEHRLVETLQRSILLDRMPEVPGVSLAARYVPGAAELPVGGDWYDVIPLSGDRLGLVIGDVVGHGVESAALMSEMRNALRAYAMEHDSPAVVLSRLHEMVRRLEPNGMATVAYLVYDRVGCQLTFAAAAHPYPLLLRPDGGRKFLTGGRSMPIGIVFGEERQDASITLPADCTLVLYTDGLVERRPSPIDVGLTALADCLEPEIGDPGATCDRILAELLGDDPPIDDVALLVMRTTERAQSTGRPVNSPDELIAQIEGQLLLEPVL